MSCRVILGVLLAGGLRADPVVGNIRAEQLPGARKVAIDYDLRSSAGPVWVTLRGSADGGLSWSLPLQSLQGNVGSGVEPGANRRIVWDAGSDWPDSSSNQVKFRITPSVGPLKYEEMVWLQGWTFTMGDADDNGTEGGDELPQHLVEVSPFGIGKYEVTKQLWDDVRQWGLANGYPDLPIGQAKGLDHPVTAIPWQAMVKWCNARSEMEGIQPCYQISSGTFRSGNEENPACDWNATGYRLPTEAEWEMAARGGLTGKRFPNSDTISHSESNYISDPQNAYDLGPAPGPHPTYGIGSAPQTAPVGSFPPNAFGIHDMSGNVTERCWDWYHWETYLVAFSLNPSGPETGTIRMVRGGSWSDHSSYCRNSTRYGTILNNPSSIYGFRVVRRVGFP